MNVVYCGMNSSTMAHPHKGTITKLGMNKSIHDNLSLFNAHEA